MPRWSYSTVTVNDFIKVSIGSISHAIKRLLLSTKDETKKGETVTRDGQGREVRLTFELRRKGRKDVQLAYEVYNGETYRGVVDIVSIPCHFGGVRYFFVCPVTGERCYSLRLVRGTFVSKKCLDQAYRGGKTMPYYSQTLSGMDRDRRAVEIAERRAKRKGVLEDSGYWVKPPKMHYATFNRLVNRISEAERKQLQGFSWAVKGLKGRLLNRH